MHHKLEMWKAKVKPHKKVQSVNLCEKTYKFDLKYFFRIITVDVLCIDFAKYSLACHISKFDCMKYS